MHNGSSYIFNKIIIR